ncbi:hypothetical protein ACEWY4_018912 [Coilia grayii]|uniref:Uncharacterized protein n=1 Tax=Coilia grayii TaxID=363190 RepID=A0ABD1JEN2_9TELE
MQHGAALQRGRVHKMSVKDMTEEQEMFERHQIRPDKRTKRRAVRCQAFPVTEAFSYDVSPSALRQLRTILQKLVHRGYTWQDDTTQQVITKELAKLPKIPLRHLEASFGDFPGTSRAKAPPPDANRKLKMEEAELSKSLQKHLQDLGFLPPSRTEAPEGSLRQMSGDRYHLIEYVQPNTQGKGKTTATFFSYHAPKLQSQAAAPANVNAPAPAAPSSSARDQERAKALLKGLQEYLAGHEPMQQQQQQQQQQQGPSVVGPSVVGPSVVGRPLGKLRYFSMLRPLAAERLKAAAAEAKADRLSGRLPSQKILEASKPPLPRIDRLFFKAPPNPAVPKEPLSLVDEKFIQNVVKQLGRQSVNIDAMTPKDLDRLSDMITKALQVVDGVGPDFSRQRGREVTEAEEAVDESESEDESDGETKTDLELERSLGTDQSDTLEVETAPRAQQTKSADSNSDDKDPGFIKQLLDYLDQSTDPGAFSLDTPPDVPVLDQAASLQEPAAKGRVSVENVQSKTTQSQLDVPQKKKKEEEEEEEEEQGLVTDPLDSLDPLGETEVERWIQSVGTAGADDAQLDPGLLPEPQKKDMGSQQQQQQQGGEEDTGAQRKRVRVEEELTVGVATYTNPDKDPEKDPDFGYVITTDSLSTDQGLNLMELLAEKAKLRVTDFLQLSVLGPAVTFRVRPNAHNVSTAELARVAAGWQSIAAAWKAVGLGAGQPLVAGTMLLGQKQDGPRVSTLKCSAPIVWRENGGGGGGIGGWWDGGTVGVVRAEAIHRHKMASLREARSLLCRPPARWKTGALGVSGGQARYLCPGRENRGHERWGGGQGPQVPLSSAGPREEVEEEEEGTGSKGRAREEADKNNAVTPQPCHCHPGGSEEVKGHCYWLECSPPFHISLPWWNVMALARGTADGQASSRAVVGAGRREANEHCDSPEKTLLRFFEEVGREYFRGFVSDPPQASQGSLQPADVCVAADSHSPDSSLTLGNYFETACELYTLLTPITWLKPLLLCLYHKSTAPQPRKNSLAETSPACFSPSSSFLSTSSSPTPILPVPSTASGGLRRMVYGRID